MTSREPTQRVTVHFPWSVYEELKDLGERAMTPFVVLAVKRALDRRKVQSGPPAATS